MGTKKANINSIYEKRLFKQIRHVLDKIRIIGYREYFSGTMRGRALLSFMTLPLLPPRKYRDHIMFSNHGIAQEIPRALNELGFIVDIINCDNLSWNPKREYVLFIGHAGINFERITRLISHRACKIYFSTGLYWKEWNRRIALRTYNLTLRRGYALPPFRAILKDEEFANRNADGIICLGNYRAAQSYSDFPLVININNAIYPLFVEKLVNKNYLRARNHFLFFSGRGNIHKGLDLIIEAFVGTGLHLHICQHMESDFKRVYNSELTNCPNIHVHGFIKMRSIEFNSLVKECAFVISGTCAEGQPGAVLECMGHGLIPILPDSANIDIEDRWGIRLEDCEIETIHSAIIRASQMTPEECHQKAEQVIQVVETNYTNAIFRNKFKDAVARIIEKAELKRA